MTEQEIKALNDHMTAMEVMVRTLEADKAKLTADNSALVSQNNVVLAVATVGSVLKEAGVPFNQKALELACQNPTMKDGKLDDTWIKMVAEAFSEGVSGRVTGMGGGDGTRPATDETVKKSLESSMKSFGVPEAGLAYAVEGRKV